MANRTWVMDALQSVSSASPDALAFPLAVVCQRPVVNTGESNTLKRAANRKRRCPLGGETYQLDAEALPV